MGACSGKRKSKDLRIDTAVIEQKPAVDAPERPVTDQDLIEQNDNVEISPPPKSYPTDFDILILVDDDEQMASRLLKDKNNALVEVSDKESEIDLAKLVYGDPERDYVEELLSNPKFIGTEI